MNVNTMELSQFDKDLIEEARQLPPADWYVTVELETRAESQQARDLLHDIGSRLYHRDEYNNDMH